MDKPKDGVEKTIQCVENIFAQDGFTSHINTCNVKASVTHKTVSIKIGNENKSFSILIQDLQNILSEAQELHDNIINAKES